MDDYFDIAIIGMGCAGGHVALSLLNKAPLLKVVILDNYGNHAQEKNWSFWEKGNSHWDEITFASWTQTRFHSVSKELFFDLAPYKYKSIRNSTFISFVKEKINQQANFKFLPYQVESIEYENNSENKNSKVCVHHTNGKVFANLVLDSRLETTELEGITLLQHFKGFFIETQEDVFDPTRFTMMDYQLVDEGTTSFMYVLPFSKKYALLEFTYFSKEIVSDDVYENFIYKYAKEVLGIHQFEIKEVEKGVIPMSTHNFTKTNTSQHYKIGTAGGWVKASTGYSFKNTERKASQLVDNILHKRSLSYKMHSKKYSIFDETLLRVLHEKNYIGPATFSRMYERNKLQNIFQFLDEESSVISELKIMNSLSSWDFIKNFFKSIFS